MTFVIVHLMSLNITFHIVCQQSASDMDVDEPFLAASCM